jgi:hypothetical protein
LEDVTDGEELVVLPPEVAPEGAATVALPLEIKTPNEPEEASVLSETAVEGAPLTPPPALPPPPPPQEVNPRRKIAPKKYLAADPADFFTDGSLLCLSLLNRTIPRENSSILSQGRIHKPHLI